MNDGVNGGYVLKARNSGMTLDVSSTYFPKVHQWPFHGEENQTWKFVRAEYTVAYDVNGGTDAPEFQTKFYKEDLTLADAEPTRTGYSFLGWATTSDAIAPEYQPGDTYTVDEDVTLYAVWESMEPDFILPASLIIIEEEAFANCSFTYVRLPETTTTIRSKAFADCDNLRHIYIPEATITIAADAFEGVSDTLTIHGADGSYAEFYAGKHGFDFVVE